MRVAISGSHSVGKTTLINAINSPYKKIDEIARQVIQHKLPHEMSEQEFTEFEIRVLKKQIELEKGSFIIDRSVYDILAYSKGHECYKQIKEMVKNHKGYDVIFYIPIEFKLKKDKIRKNDENYREEIDKQIVKILKNKNVVELNGNLENRLKGVYKWRKI